MLERALNSAMLGVSVVGAGVKKCHPEGAQSRVSCERQRASLRGDAEGRQSAALPPPPLGAAMEAEGSQAVTGVGELPEPGRALMTERRQPLCAFGRVSIIAAMISIQKSASAIFAFE